MILRKAFREIGCDPLTVAAAQLIGWLANAGWSANTRAAYVRAVASFFRWCEVRGLAELGRLEPVHVAAYVEHLAKMLGFTGVSDGTARAEAILALETRLAEKHWDRAERRNREPA